MAVNYRRMSCTPEHVFEVLANGWLYPSWVVGASRIRGVDKSWPSKDARIYHSVGSWPIVSDDFTAILEWDPPKNVSLKARAWPLGEGTVTIEAKPRGSGCIVRITEDIESGPGKLVPRFIRTLMLKIRNKEALQRLAFIAEGLSGDSEPDRH